MDRWNKVLESNNIDHRFILPHRGFNRRIGVFAGQPVSPDGEILTEEQWAANVGH